MDHDSEFQWIEAKGLTPAEALPQLRERSLATGQSPLSLLLADGVISQDTAQSLRKTDPNATLQEHEAAHSPTPPSAHNFPVTGWARFQEPRFLGQGGMGRVFKARDPRLDRPVAVKFMSGSSPEARMRFVREARIQATIDHPNVCKVYEAGEVEGHAYIAMTYIEGKNLSEATAEMGMDQILVLFRQIAAGLNEAHRSGLIHRDIKPRNIMVAALDHGPGHAYVLDFGLARDTHAESVTRTGEVMGTPGFMSPEQAMGDLRNLDRRSDIYSLGASLYLILSGRLPVEGQNSGEILTRLIQGEAQPIRRFLPDIAGDVETMVMKCLQKRPADRYQSAQALADDLGRYLNGEPISARPTSMPKRLWRLAQKHKPLVVTGLAALLLLSMSLTWTWNLSREAQVRETLTREFTSRVEKIEALGRYMVMIPPHDLTHERENLRQHMTAIEKETALMGSAAVGPGHYALGRGYLILDEPAQALTHLQAAWDVGFQDNRCAAALSNALGTLYQRSLVQAARMPNPETRDRTLADIESRYRSPALKYAALGGPVDQETTAYASARIAFYEGRYQQAVDLLENVDTGLPWFYQIAALRADILMARAGAANMRGEYQAAAQGFEEARAGYQQALTIAPSDPALNRALAEVDRSHMDMAFYRDGELSPHFERGLAALETGLILEPNRADLLVAQATFYRRRGERERLASADEAQHWLQLAVETCSRILAREPLHSQANNKLGRTLSQLAQLEASSGRDPGPRLTAAQAAFERVAVEHRGLNYYNELGLVLKTLARHAEDGGKDSAMFREQEINAYLHAAELDPQNPAPLINRASALLAMAGGSSEPEPLLKQGVATLEKALTLAPEHIAVFFYLGRFQADLSEDRFQRGMDPRQHLAQARLYFQKGADLNQKLPHFPNSLGVTRLQEAKMAWESGSDPSPHLSAAHAHFQTALTRAAKYGPALHNLAEVHTLAAFYALRRGLIPKAALEQALTAYQTVLEHTPQAADSLAWLGETHRLRAETAARTEGDVDTQLDQALAALEQALELNPKSGKAHQFLGRLHLSRMELEPPTPQALESLYQKSQTAFESAADLGVREAVLEQAAACYQFVRHAEAAELPTAAPAALGLTLVNRILEQRQLAEALILRAALVSTKPPPHATEAKTDFERGLMLNPNLKWEWMNHELAVNP